MKNLLLTLCLTAFSSVLFSQDYFEIKEIGSKYSKEFIELSLRSADFCGFFYSDERRELKFDDGAIVEFKSASEVSSINAACVKVKNIKADEAEWRIADSGHVLRILSIQPTK